MAILLLLLVLLADHRALRQTWAFLEEEASCFPVFLEVDASCGIVVACLDGDVLDAAFLGDVVAYLDVRDEVTFQDAEGMLQDDAAFLEEVGTLPDIDVACEDGGGGVDDACAAYQEACLAAYRTVLEAWTWVWAGHRWALEEVLLPVVDCHGLDAAAAVMALDLAAAAADRHFHARHHCHC